MYFLRCAAARAVAQRPSAAFAGFRYARSPLVPLQSTKPTPFRSLHHARVLFSQESKATEPSESSESNVLEESDARAEKSAAASGVVDAASSTTAKSSDSQGVVERAGEIAGRAAEAVQSTAASTAQRAQEAFVGSENQVEDRTRLQRVLYVGNLFFQVTAEELKELFAPYGEIVNYRIVSDERGLSRGFGYVEFADPISAKSAIQQLDQQHFQGRRMTVQLHVPRSRRVVMPSRPANHPPSQTLFIGNMSYQMSDRDLNDLFKEIRDVLDVRVAIDRNTGQPRGFAHADFIDIAAATRAKEHLEGKIVYGRQLRVDFTAHASTLRERRNSADN